MQSGERYYLDGRFHLKLLINLVVKTQNTAEIKSTLRTTYNFYNVMLNILTHFHLGAFVHGCVFAESVMSRGIPVLSMWLQ